MRPAPMLLAGLLAASAASPSAAALLPLSRPQLCARAELVVVAEVTGSETRWSNGAEPGIETRVWLAPERTLRGRAPDALEVVLPGGQVGSVRQWVEDVPRLVTDRSYLLFLRRAPDGTWRVYGGETGAVAVRSASGGAGERLEDALSSVEGCRER